MTLSEAIHNIISETPLMVVGYLALRRAMVKDKQEIKDHNEVSVKQANGSFGYSVQSMRIPMYIKTYSQSVEGKPKFLFLQLNQPYADLFGLKRKDMMGKTDIEAGVPKEIADFIYSKDIQVWSNQKKEMFIKTLTNGEQRVFDKIPFVSDEGKVIGVLGYEVGSHCESSIKSKAP